MSKVKLSKKYIYKICKEALKEDLHPSGDITSKLLNNKNNIRAKIISNSALIFFIYKNTSDLIIEILNF